MTNDSNTLPETNSSPLQMLVSNRNLHFQGSIFRGELLVSGRVYLDLTHSAGRFAWTLHQKKCLNQTLVTFYQLYQLVGMDHHFISFHGVCFFHPVYINQKIFCKNEQLASEKHNVWNFQQNIVT